MTRILYLDENHYDPYSAATLEQSFSTVAACRASLCVCEKYEVKLLALDSLYPDEVWMFRALYSQPYAPEGEERRAIFNYLWDKAEDFPN